MTAEAQLQQACDRWESLALAEGEAIRTRDWSRLALSQNALQELQPQITRYLEQARQEWMGQTGAAPMARERFFRTRADDLIRIARQNQALLEQTRIAAVTEISNYRQATRTLRRLRAAYTPATQPGWTSFS